MEAATARCAVTFAAAVSFFPQEKRPEAPAAVSRAPSTREKVSGVPVLSAPTRDRETAVVMLSATPATSEESHGTREARKRRTTHTAPSTRAHGVRVQHLGEVRADRQVISGRRVGEGGRGEGE